MPEWAEEALLHNQTLEFLTSVFYEAFSHTNEMKKIRGGFLIKEILERSKNKTLSFLNPDRLLWIYSAHDLTIVNILNTLNLYDQVIEKMSNTIHCLCIYSKKSKILMLILLIVIQMHIPPFASSLYFELYKRGTEYFIQLFYRRAQTETFPPLKIPNCDIMCPLEQFYKLYYDVLPTDSEDYDTLCKLQSHLTLNELLVKFGYQPFETYLT